MHPELATCICKTWKEAYQIALSEADKNKLAERIADAELALMLRARELVYTTGDHIEEKTAMEDAMDVLHALRTIAANRSTSHTGDEAVVCCLTPRPTSADGLRASLFLTSREKFCPNSFGGDALAKAAQDNHAAHAEAPTAPRARVSVACGLR